MKLITFVVPCYNSAGYIERCVESLLPAGSEAEIILIDDGSTDATPDIIDRLAREYPAIIRAIHQQNGGHGEGVNQGIRHARGVYFKVVDSDDWLDSSALPKVMDKLREFVKRDSPIDLLICNYVYDHLDDGTRKVMRFRNALPVERGFRWTEIGHFRITQYMLMHAVICRTQMLVDGGLWLPRHTYYVDNLFVYRVLPLAKSVYYMDIELYHYYIGREEQSVNEQVMAGRIDQQLRVTRLMIDAYDFSAVPYEQRRVARYLGNYLNMLLAISSIFSILADSPEKRRGIWRDLRQKDRATYMRLRYSLFGIGVNLPGAIGRKLSVGAYRIARVIYKFN